MFEQIQRQKCRNLNLSHKCHICNLLLQIKYKLFLNNISLQFIFFDLLWFWGILSLSLTHTHTYIFCIALQYFIRATHIVLFKKHNQYYDTQSHWKKGLWIFNAAPIQEEIPKVENSRDDRKGDTIGWSIKRRYTLHCSLLS